MNEIPDFVSDSLNKHIITLNSQSDELIAEEVDDDIELHEIIGSGGSAAVYKAYSKHLDSEVAVKLCDPGLEMVTCASFKDEVKNAYSFLLLNESRKCYNYPIFYGYYHTCLFFSPDQTRIILEYIDRELGNGYNEYKDRFIIYCITPRHISLPPSLLQSLTENLPSEMLLKGINTLPKTKNSTALLNFSNLKRMGVYEYLSAELENLNCSIFIMQQYLIGKTTFKNLREPLKDTLFFEYIYSNLIPIIEFGKVYADSHGENVMIVPCNVIRVYKHKEMYYIIPGDMLYRVDAQSLSDVNPDRVEINSFGLLSIFTLSQKKWMDGIRRMNALIVLDQLFQWASENRIEVMDKEHAELFMTVNRNYKLVVTGV
jgi:hypothetical protein